MKIANNINFRKIFVRLAVHETQYSWLLGVGYPLIATSDEGILGDEEKN